MTTENTQPNSESSAEAPSSKNAPPVFRDPLKELSEALRKERAELTANDAEEQEAPTGDKPAGKSKSKPPKNLEQLAEALGLEVEAVYAIEVPAKAKGAKALKLGELKDLAAQHGDLEVRTLRLDEDRRTLERERLTAETEFRELLQSLPADAIKPEAMQKLRGVLAKRHSEQRARTLEAMPEWEDDKIRQEQLKGITEHLAEYGIPETYLLANLDHRLMRLVRDAFRDARTIRKALEQVQERKPTTPPKARGGTQPVKKRVNGGPLNRDQQHVADFMATINSAASNRGD